MEKCHSAVHECGTSKYCDTTVNRCQDCQFICNKQRTPDFKECKKHCFGFYKRIHDGTIKDQNKLFTTNAASETTTTSLNKMGSTPFTPLYITVLIIIILAIMVALLAVTVYFLTSNSKMHATFSCWRKQFSSKNKLQTMHYMKADKAGGGKRSSDCSQLEYVSYREEDMHRLQQDAGAPLMQLGVIQSLHPHSQQHKSCKISSVFDTSNENVVLIHNCDVNKTSLSRKQTIPLNLKEKQDILNYNNGNRTGVGGSGNSDDNIITDLANVSNNPTNNHNMLNLNDNGNPSTSDFKGCVHYNDTRKQKEPTSRNPKQNMMNKADADDTSSDYSSYEDDNIQRSAVEQVSVGVGSFTAEITQQNAKPNSARVEDRINEVDNINRKAVTQSQRLNVSILDGSPANKLLIKTDGHLFNSTNKSKPVTPSQILFATNKDEGTTANSAVDSLSADVKGLPAPVNVKSQVQTDNKQVLTINAADEQNKDTLFAIDEYYSSHVKPDLAASELPHTPKFTEQSVMEVHRTGDIKNVYLLNEAITPKATDKMLDNEEVLKNVQMRTYTEQEHGQVRRSSQQSSNGDTILKSQYTVGGELIPQQDKLMSTHPEQIYIHSSPVNQQIKVIPVNQHNNMTYVNKPDYLTHVNQSNPATVNNPTFPHCYGNHQEELLNGPVEGNMYTAPVYHTSELNAPVCQPSDICVQHGQSAVISESSKSVGDKFSKRKPHPNKQLYEVLKHIDWVDGYYSEGHSIEVYADLEHITLEVALKELSVRTGAPPDKFHVKQNDSILA